MTVPPTVRGGGVTEAPGISSVEVTPFTTMNEAEGPKATVVPSSVIVPPGVSVWPPITTDGGVTVAGLNVDVSPFTTIKEADGPRAIVVPDTVIVLPGASV